MNNACQPCFYACATCSGALVPSNTMNCLTCAGGRSWDSMTKNCTCSGATYDNGNSATCQPCYYACATCSGALVPSNTMNCLTCAGGRSWDSMTKNCTCSGNTIDDGLHSVCSSCLLNQYSALGVCQNCPSVCSACSSSIFCTNCIYPYQLISNFCYAPIPSSHLPCLSFNYAT